METIAFTVRTDNDNLDLLVIAIDKVVAVYEQMSPDKDDTRIITIDLVNGISYHLFAKGEELLDAILLVLQRDSTEGTWFDDDTPELLKVVKTKN